MYWWYVLEADGKTVTIMGTSLFQEPPLSLGPAQLTAPNTPVPSESATMQVVNGVTTVVVDTTKIIPVLGGLKLF